MLANLDVMNFLLKSIFVFASHVTLWMWRNFFIEFATYWFNKKYVQHKNI